MAQRQYPRALGISVPGKVTLQMVRDILTRTTEARKVETELQELATNLGTADPTVPGTQADLNFGRNRIQFTTPATANTEIAIAHNLGRVPVGCDFGVMPLIAGGGTVRARWSKSPDNRYLYLKFPDVVDQSIIVSAAIY